MKTKFFAVLSLILSCQAFAHPDPKDLSLNQGYGTIEFLNDVNIPPNKEYADFRAADSRSYCKLYVKEVSSKDRLIKANTSYQITNRYKNFYRHTYRNTFEGGQAAEAVFELQSNALTKISCGFFEEQSTGTMGEWHTYWIPEGKQLEDMMKDFVLFIKPNPTDISGK